MLLVWIGSSKHKIKIVYYQDTFILSLKRFQYKEWVKFSQNKPFEKLTIRSVVCSAKGSKGIRFLDN